MDKQNHIVMDEIADGLIAEKPIEQEPTVKNEVSREENVFKLLRLAHGLSKKELAKKLDCSSTLIVSIENGQRKISRAMLNKMASAYEMKPIHIFHLLNEYDITGDFSDIEVEPSFKVYREELLKILIAISELEQ